MFRKLGFVYARSTYRKVVNFLYLIGNILSIFLTTVDFWRTLPVFLGLYIGFAPVFIGTWPFELFCLLVFFVNNIVIFIYCVIFVVFWVVQVFTLDNWKFFEARLRNFVQILLVFKVSCHVLRSFAPFYMGFFRRDGQIEFLVWQINLWSVLNFRP